MTNPIPTPPRWPQSIRLGQQTYITLDVPSTIDVIIPEPNSLDDSYILCEEYTDFNDESYASLSREYYTGDDT